jgi:signal transduction histidine kinase
VAKQRRLRDLAIRRYLPKRNVRLRLATLYCALFFPLGVVLVVIASVMTFFSLRPVAFSVAHIHGHLHEKPVVHLSSSGAGLRTVSPRPLVHLGSLRLDLQEFLLWSCITLAAMIGISLLLGWLLAGRVLRPLRTITETTRNISEHDLHQRLALPGPRDDLTELGDTIDGLLGRLERAFASQRHFVANASHELRTPLTVDRAMLQVALSDPHITLDSLRAACGEVLEAGREQERLIDALLTLARSQQGLERKEPVDLAAVIGEALQAHARSAANRGVAVDASLADATVPGDARLLNQLASNLVDNAIRHNVTDGRVHVTVADNAAGATLTVSNTGPSVAADQVSRLLQPFQRGTSARTGSPNGLGLGLSIVADIAEAHEAYLDVRARPEGGLTVTVSFPAYPSSAFTPDSNRHPAGRWLTGSR